jgi:penicillin-binding protein 1A
MGKDDFELNSGANWRGTVWKQPFYKRAWFSALMALIILVALTGLGVFMFLIQPMRERAETFDLSEMKKLEAASIVYDRNGGELAKLYMLNRTPVSIREVPQHLIDALTSQEDSRFFQHHGVDYIGLARAMYLNFKAGEVTQGASTITQQLARQSYNLLERSYKRKILEAFLAQRIEREYSKTEILELYLNRIYFGAGFYGIEAAARGYFGKEVKNLTLDEAATICGIIKSPNRLSPLRHPEEAIKARNQVLQRMADEKHLSRDEAATQMVKPLVTTPQSADPRLSYVFEEVRQMVMDMVGEERASVGGFQIQTTIDPVLQKTAEESLKKHLAIVETRPDYQHQTYAQFKGVMADYKARMAAGIINPTTPRPKPEYLQGAALAVDNRDGSILAMVGGRDFLDSQYNRALEGARAAGMAFTPFVYATAFSRPEFFPGSQIEDKPIDNRYVMIGGFTGILGEWGTEIADPKWTQQNISARESLVTSRVATAVRLGYKLGQAVNGERPATEMTATSLTEWQPGLAAVKETARKAGISTPLKDVPASFLGASEMRLDEMCLAYSTFPNQGKRPQGLYFIRRILDSGDKVVFEVNQDEDRRVAAMDPVAAYQTHTCLEEALHRGTGSAAAAEYGLGNFPSAGKTGTHYEFKDLWFMGYTSAITCGVWAGFDKPKQIYSGAFSNRIALPVWTDIINASVKSHPAEAIPPPDGAEHVELCRKSGMRATDFCYEKITDGNGETKSVRATYEENLRPGTNVEGYCTAHTGEGLPADFTSVTTLTLDSGSHLHPDAQKFAHVEPVRMQGLTVLGPDPYLAQQPVLRAQPASSDGATVRRPEVVDPEESMTDESPVKLAPPPPLKIEMEEGVVSPPAKETASSGSTR